MSQGLPAFDVVIDLRHKAERERTPCGSHYPATAHILSHDIEREVDPPHVAAQRYGGEPGAILDFYRDFYAGLPLSAPYMVLFGEAFARLCDLRGQALIHCTAGKDRTGVLVALVQYALGVSRADILSDYLATRAGDLEILRDGLRQRLGEVGGVAISDAVMDELLDVRAEYIESMFAALERRFGSVELYFARCGLTDDALAALRANLLIRQDDEHPIGITSSIGE